MSIIYLRCKKCKGTGFVSKFKEGVFDEFKVFDGFKVCPQCNHENEIIKIADDNYELYQPITREQVERDVITICKVHENVFAELDWKFRKLQKEYKITNLYYDFKCITEFEINDKLHLYSGWYYVGPGEEDDEDPKAAEFFKKYHELYLNSRLKIKRLTGSMGYYSESEEKIVRYSKDNFTIEMICWNTDPSPKNWEIIEDDLADHEIFDILGAVEDNSLLDLSKEELTIYVAAEAGVDEAIRYLNDRGIVRGSLMAGCNNYGTVKVSGPIKNPPEKAPRIHFTPEGFIPHEEEDYNNEEQWEVLP